MRCSRVSGATGEAVPAVRPWPGQLTAAGGMGRVPQGKTHVSWNINDSGYNL